MVSSMERFHCIQDSQWVPMVSSIERFYFTDNVSMHARHVASKS